MQLTQQELKQLLHYDYLTGIFTWLVKPNKTIQVGDVAGGLQSEGYIRIRVKGKYYYAHRLAWLYMTGNWPSEHIDHKDTIRHHNWWDNLRESTHQQNTLNQTRRVTNTSGVKGVHWNTQQNKWQARIAYKGKRHTVGYFDTLSDAENALIRKRKELHGEFTNNG